MASIPPASATDYRGITFSKQKYLTNLSGPQMMEISDEEHNSVYYDFLKYAHLAEGCNPNILELVYLPQDSVIKTTPEYLELLKYRHLFISKQAERTYVGYATAQIKRAKSIGKKGNMEHKYINITGLKVLKFCYDMYAEYGMDPEDIRRVYGKHFVEYLKKMDPVSPNDIAVRTYPTPTWDSIKADPFVVSMRPPAVGGYISKYGRDEHCFEFRPRPWPHKSLMGESEYDVAAVEGMTNAYRLYRNGTGFLDKDCNQVYCHSISEERERKDFDGIIVVNLDQYHIDRREYDSFWEWMAGRNEARYTRDWDKDTMTDNKSLMHTMRLLLCAKNVALEGVPLVRFTGDNKKFLMDIRAGKYSYEYMIRDAETRAAELRTLFQKSSLPAHPNGEHLWQVYMSIMAPRFKKELDGYSFNLEALRK